MSTKTYDTIPPSPSTGEGPRPAPGPSAIPPKPDPEDVPNPAAEAFHRLTRDVNELKEYASFYVATRVDGVKRTVRNIGLYAVLGVLGLIAGGALVATAVGLMVVGLAELLGNAFGGRYWLGDIVAGVIVLGVIGAGAWFMMNKLTGTWRSQTVKKYEQRKQSQRQDFGRDVSDRAAQARSSGPGQGH